MRRLLLTLRSFDWILFSLAALLIAFGLVLLYSLTLNVEKPDIATFRQQLLFAGLGIFAMLLVSMVDYRYLRSYGWVFFVCGAFLLIGVVLFGTEIRGAKSWFTFGGVSFQPVEIAKLCLIAFFAKYYSDHAGDLFQLRHLLVSGAGTGLYLALTLVQPDLGSALILLGLFIAVALLVHVRRSHLALLIGVFAVAAAAGWFLLRDYQRERILTVFNPSRDPLGIGYNVKQSTVAIGSGRLFGRGLGLGTQSQLKFLPEQKTDFVFAVIAEELGFVGAGLLLAVYTLLLLRLYRIAVLSRDVFGLYVVFGVFIMLGIQMVMNVGMNLGLMPVAGVPLPFVSAGGSSLLAAMIALGVAQSVHMRQRGAGMFG